MLWAALLGAGVCVLAVLEACRWATCSKALSGMPGPTYLLPFVGDMMAFVADPPTWAWRRWGVHGRPMR